MSYDNLYKSTKNFWGKEPNKLLQMIWQKIMPNSFFLDLGCGQGRDSIFMARQDFKVVAIDDSNEAIKQLDKVAKKEKLNIETICHSITDFKITKNKFLLINAYNILQFLDKNQAMDIIDKIKKNLKPNGYVIISCFIITDPSYLKPENQTKTYFKPNELKELFAGWEIVFYFEGKIADKAHLGANQPHQHGVVRLIAKKSK